MEFMVSGSKTDHFIVDELFNFPADDEEEMEIDVVSGDSSPAVDTATLAADQTCRSFVDTQLPNLCVPPYDDLAEFEWLSNFVEESFSNEDLQKLQLISGLNARSENASKNHQSQIRPTLNQTDYNTVFNIDMTVPGKARTKRSRAASCNWASRLLVNPPTVTGPIPATLSNFTSTEVQKKNVKKEFDDNSSSNNEDGRKCVHCATDKTPQWRSGPLGPKTLCNACGVRYKSGRLVPEYRPAASPTFIMTKHSNSHRKVLELRRQKQVQNIQQFIDHQNINDDYLIHQHIGPDYRQLI